MLMVKVDKALYNRIDYLKSNQVAVVMLVKVRHLEDHNRKRKKRISH